jgi:sortase (surface protein transpeptidase)
LGISTKRLPKTGVKVANWAMPKYPSSNKAMENSYIVINKIGINAPLYQASNIGDDLLVGDSEILNTGNMFYGHNSRSAFESLWQLRKGDSIIVTKNGNTQIYTVSNTAYIN